VGATTVGLNVLVNGILPERLHIPASLTAAGIITAFAARAGAGLDDQGLVPRDVPRGVAYGVGAATPIVAGIGVGLLFNKSRDLYGERRIAGATFDRAAYEIWLRIPLGTALPEEMIFRGALLGLFSRRHSPVVATALTSFLFGLWHIAPTIDRLETNPAIKQRTRAQQMGWVALTVATTSAAGFLLSFLRFRSKSIVAPWLAHSAANAAGFGGGWLTAKLAEWRDSKPN
jgi:membrane protease YdiL (CAAX protease family)